MIFLFYVANAEFASVFDETNYNSAKKFVFVSLFYDEFPVDSDFDSCFCLVTNSSNWPGNCHNYVLLSNSDQYSHMYQS